MRVACTSPRGWHHGRSGFSLVELLVVIGIIAVLISLLLPSVRRVKEHVNQTVCLSNLRQLSMAFIAYTQANEDKFPRPAVNSLPEDWIYWQPGRDLNQSRIVPYLGNRFDPNVFRCPSDEVVAHKYGYLFSYTVNFNLCAYSGSPAPYVHDSISRTQVHDPTRCILIVEESDQTIDDGCWAWQPQYGAGVNVTSIRHDRYSIGEENVSNPSQVTNGRTNVGFVDGHVEFIPRWQTYQPPFYNPTYNVAVGGYE